MIRTVTCAVAAMVLLSCARDAECARSQECDDGQSCINGRCAFPPPPRARGEGEGEGVIAEGEGEGVIAEGEGEGVTAEGEGEGVVAEGEGEGAPPPPPQVVLSGIPSVVERGANIVGSIAGDVGCVLSSTPDDSSAMLQNGGVTMSPTVDTTYTVTCASSTTSQSVRVVFAEGLSTTPAQPQSGGSTTLQARGPTGASCAVRILPSGSPFSMTEGQGATSGQYSFTLVLTTTSDVSVTCSVGGVSSTSLPLSVRVLPRVEGVVVRGDSSPSRALSVSWTSAGASTCEVLETQGTTTQSLAATTSSASVSATGRSGVASYAVRCADSSGQATTTLAVTESDGAPTQVLWSSSSVTSLAGLSSVDVLMGDLVLNGEMGAGYTASRLRELGGRLELSNDTSANGAPVLAFHALRRICGSVDITNNADLISLTDTDANPNVASFDVLAVIGGGLTISGNTSLSSVVLPALASIGGALNVQGNTALINMRLPAGVDVSGAATGSDILLLNNGMSCVAPPSASFTSVRDVFCPLQFVGDGSPSSVLIGSDAVCSFTCP